MSSFVITNALASSSPTTITGSTHAGGISDGDDPVRNEQVVDDRARVRSVREDVAGDLCLEVRAQKRCPSER